MKLNLGSGTKYLKGWENVDVTSIIYEKMPDESYRLVKVDEVVDLGDMPWPFKDKSAKEIMASHILEHFDKKTGVKFLEECYRVLAVGGTLFLAVPDMDVFADYINTGDDSRLYVQGGKPYIWRDLNHFGGGDARESKEELKHKYIYTFEHLAYTLESVGFKGVYKREPSELDNEEWGNFTLYVTATK